MESLKYLRANPTAQIDLSEDCFAEPIAAVDEHLNSRVIQYYYDMAASAKSNGQLSYVMVGDEKTSTDAAILMGVSCNEEITPLEIARAESVRHLAELAGRSDFSGNPLPVLLTAPLTKGPLYGLSQKERAILSEGRYDPLAERHRDLIEEIGVIDIGGIVGYCQTAPFSEALYFKLRESAAITGSVQIQESPSVVSQSAAALALKLLIEHMPIKGAGMIPDIGTASTLYKEIFQSIPNPLAYQLKRLRRNAFLNRISALGGQGSHINDLLEFKAKFFVLSTSSNMATSSELATALIERSCSRTGQDSVRQMIVTGPSTHLDYISRIGHFAAITAANL